jgi:2-phospho-L-lactate guanylyltransferase (CobY/MobA/RfbA family)
VTRRVVAVLAPADAPPDSLAAAMLEDVVDLVAEMQQVDGAVVAGSGAESVARAVAWPGMPVLAVADATVVAGLGALSEAGADEGALVCADAPDLPALLVGKLFSALTTVEVAVCPGERGDLVALAARLPAPDWLAGLEVSLDTDGALDRLRAAAPRRGLQIGSGWHRVGGVADAMRLDRGLEGWEATRAWLARR